MENELLQVLAALNRINVHGEADCQSVLCAISTLRDVILRLQNPDEQEAADHE